VGGGISLAVPVESITLLQVIEAVEGPLCLNDCLTNPPQCAHIDTCPAYPYLSEAQGSLRQILDVSFAEVMAKMPQPESPIPMLAPLPTSPNGKGSSIAKVGDAP
jgi:DNA-binding IscR family transcriptional regulator